MSDKTTMIDTGMGNGIDRDGIVHDDMDTQGGISRGTTDC